MSIDLISYIDSTGIPYKIHGSEIVLQYCPYCEGPDKKDYSHFYFNVEKQTFYCHKCGQKGNLYKFMLDRGDTSPITKAKEIEYKRPKEQKTFTSDLGNFHKWYQKERGIDLAILKKYKVGRLQSNGYTYIVYQYYDQKNTLFNRKYKLYPRAEGREPYRTEKDAESNFYGLQFINPEVDLLFIVAGEDDCHALAQLGFENVLSVPYGDRNYSPSMDKIVKQFSQIYLLFDNDPSGQAGARKFAEKAGLTKCLNVILPFKDARECLLQGLNYDDMLKYTSNPEYFRHEEIIKAGDVKSGFMKYMENTDRLIGRCIRIPEFNRIVGGIRPGELTILTGHTGRGKSTLAYNFIRWAEEVGYNCMIMSFENQLFPVIHKLIEIYSQERVRIFDAVERKYKLMQSTSWIENWYDKLNEKDIYFLNKSKHVKDGYYSLDKLGEVIEYAVKFYDVNLFVIDHLHYFLKVSDARNPAQKIDEAMRQIKQWTLKYNVHILLLVHPHMTDEKKDGKPPKLGLNSVKGAISISQESDNFWVISRNEKDEEYTRLTVLKNREMGKTGDFKLKVLDNLNTYTPWI